MRTRLCDYVYIYYFIQDERGKPKINAVLRSITAIDDRIVISGMRVKLESGFKPNFFSNPIIRT